jgi:Ser/Thr protein kinase RdoA (MazF antagonist)
VYEFAEGYCLSDFVWWPSARRDLLRQAGRTLGLYHQAVADMTPTFRKWDGYHPTGHERWRAGDWFRQALRAIRPLVQKQSANGLVDEFARLHIDALEHMLELESVVEGRSDLSKQVIHGDYAPWNVLFRPGQLPLVLDFNAARLEIKVFDVVFATFWFAWHRDRFDRGRARAFQAGYSEAGQLGEADLRLASDVFRWVMARAMAERLRRHYQEQVRLRNPRGMQCLFDMCVFAERQPQQLIAGLSPIGPPQGGRDGRD